MWKYEQVNMLSTYTRIKIPREVARPRAAAHGFQQFICNDQVDQQPANVGRLLKKISHPWTTRNNFRTRPLGKSIIRFSRVTSASTKTLHRTRMHQDQSRRQTFVSPKDNPLLTAVRPGNPDDNQAARAVARQTTGSGLVENFQK